MGTVLFISNITYKITSFSSSSIYAAHKMGMRFIHAANWSETPIEQIELLEKENDITICNVPISRSPFSLSNIEAFKQLCRIVKENNVEYIHCNTPVGGLLGRLVGKKCNVKKVIYQAHGFHFYKGAPLKNWLLFFPVESFLARFTDVIITINKEDYFRAKRDFMLRNHGIVYYVPGVGIDLSQYKNIKINKSKKRKALNLNNDDVVMISAGELNENKNNRVLIEAMNQINNPRLHYLVCGKGPLEKELKRLAKKYNLDNNVHFLGYRTDVTELLFISDIFVMPSYREGLSRSIMEAMACGLPCVVSKIRGNTDLIKNGYNGYTCNPNSKFEFSEKIKKLSSNKEIRIIYGKRSKLSIQKFEMRKVVAKLIDIYEKIPNER